MTVKDLDVFKLAHELALKIYQITAAYPEGERFGLTSQMRRASASICANLMEGSHRFSKNEYKHFVSIARGSCGELKYHVILSKDLGYINEQISSEASDAYERVSMMLTKLYYSLNG